MLHGRISMHNEKIILGAIAVVAIVALIAFAVVAAKIKPVTPTGSSPTGTFSGSAQSSLFGVVKGALCAASTTMQHVVDRFNLSVRVARPTGC